MCSIAVYLQRKHDLTWLMLAQCSILTWQSFIRTSYSLSFKLAEVISDTPLLAWRNPARTNQFIETPNWHGIWYRPRITTCQFLISDSRDAHNANHRLNLEPCSKGRRRKSEFQSRWDAFHTQILGNSPLFPTFWLVPNFINYVIVLSWVSSNVWKMLNCIWLPSTLASHAKASHDSWSRVSWHDSWSCFSWHDSFWSVWLVSSLGSFQQAWFLYSNSCYR